MTLYPWQEDLLRNMCRTDESGRWAAREVVTVVARQNGKGEVLVARELAGIYLFGEKSIFHSAHFMDTAIDAQRRLWEIIEASDELLYWWENETSELPRKQTGNGKEAIIFPNGAIIYFRTRTKKTGRGLSVELLVLDECFDLPKETYSALSKLTRAKERAQTVYISSPVDQKEHDHGKVFSAKRWAAIDGAPRTLLAEWSPGKDDDPFVQETWAKCNPSLVDEGFGAQLQDIEADARAAQNSEALLGTFMVETLAAGDWYPRDGEEVDDFEPVLDADQIADMTLESVDLSALSGLVVAVDVSPDRQAASVALGGRRGEEVIGYVGYHGPVSTADIAATVLDVCEKVSPWKIVIDPKGPASVIGEALDRKGLEVTKMTYPDVKAATAAFLQGRKDGRWFVVDPDGLMAEAFSHAELKMDSSGGAKWARFEGRGTICQLTAVNFAMWQSSVHEEITPLRRPPAVRSRAVKSNRTSAKNIAF
ncbi:terminase large subunit domain-containing protein [Corynebacterium mastitidis]|uniref:terminase large subunit domain-containing protein n=1 Tax=Corynebacterium mastitidis TaxID=161890 RepID=UPI000370C9FC|nr:terminase family protein [Corynebacterium mastitidis]